MRLTDYYKMVELKERASRRFDCVASTGEYEPFEFIANKSRDKRFFLYYTDIPDTFSARVKRRVDKSISNGKSISSVFVPDLYHPLKGYGDTKGTRDALLFLFSEDGKQIEIFVARGHKDNAKGFCNLFIDGELDDEIEALRLSARPTNV
jgi:hypothetical protein